MGDKFGQVILMFSEIISGFSIGFITSWKLTLVLFSSLPIMILAFVISGYCGENVLIKASKTYEKAGGLAEELLYNIKTVTSFCNFDFEINRYENLIEEVNKYKIKGSLIEGITFGLMILGFFTSFSVCILYSRILINNKEINYSTGEPYNGGDIAKVLSCVLSGIFAINGLGPNIQVMKESCIASSDYFTLLKRNPNIYISEKNIIIDRDVIQGKIEFKNVKFKYNSNKSVNNNYVLNDLNLIFEPGKK